MITVAPVPIPGVRPDRRAGRLRCSFCRRCCGGGHCRRPLATGRPARTARGGSISGVRKTRAVMVGCRLRRCPFRLRLRRRRPAQGVTAPYVFGGSLRYRMGRKGLPYNVYAIVATHYDDVSRVWLRERPSWRSGFCAGFCAWLPLCLSVCSPW